MNTSGSQQARVKTQPMRVQVKLFAGMAAEVAQRQLVLEPTVTTVAGVRAALAAAVPAIAPLLARSAVAVGGRYAADETLVGPDDEIAIIPPVSGG
jgi:molybdopterin converting factor small subunit